MFLLKIHQSDKGKVAAICDAELLGKSFSAGEVCLEVNEDFFGGEKAGVEDVVQAVKSCATANIVGNRVISELLARGIIKESGVKEVKSIRYAMLFKI